MRNGFRLKLFSCRERRTLADHPQCFLFNPVVKRPQMFRWDVAEPATSDLDVLVKRVSSLLPRRFTTCDGADDVSERNGFETFHDAFERDEFHYVETTDDEFAFARSEWAFGHKLTSFQLVDVSSIPKKSHRHVIP